MNLEQIHLLLHNQDKVVQTQIAKMLATDSANLIQLLAQDEASGNVSADSSGAANPGAWNGNQDLQDAYGPDGKPVCGYDGTAFNRIYSADFNTDFNGQDFTVSLWARVAASFWADTDFKYLGVLKVDANNYIYLRKENAVNQIGGWYNAGATTLGAIENPFSSTDWFNLTVSADLVADAFDVYLNGAKVAATQGSLGTWAGALFTDTTCLGCGYTATIAEPFVGHLGAWGVWANKLTDAEVLGLQ